MRQEIPPDPIPQGIHRRPCNTARVLMVAAIVDNKRLKRLEQQPRGIFYAGSYITLLANNAAEFLENEVRANDGFAAQHAALEFADQQRTRPWRELAQKMPQPFDGRLGARHPRSIRIQASGLDTAADVKKLLSVILNATRRLSMCRPDCGRPSRGRFAAARRYKSCGYRTGSYGQPADIEARERSCRNGRSPDCARTPARQADHARVRPSARRRRAACPHHPGQRRSDCR